jgi:hypothetical protein
MKTTEQETNPPKLKRNKYSPQFKEQALERAVPVGWRSFVLGAIAR